jgi:hypothetical protein
MRWLLFIGLHSYLIVPLTHSVSFFTGTPLESTASEMPHVARQVAMAINIDNSAKLEPGQDLKMKYNCHKTQAQFIYDRPKPSPETKHNFSEVHSNIVVQESLWLEFLRVREDPWVV